MVEPERAPTTVDAIRWRLHYVLLPFFQHHRLSEITIAEVDRYRAAKVRERDLLTAARAAGEQTDRRPLSNSTINRTIAAAGADPRPGGGVRPHPREPGAGASGASSRPTRPQRPYLDSAGQIVALLDAAGELDRESRADRQHVNRRAQLATLVFAGLADLRVRWRCGGATSTWPAAG